jgi:hypothetical protein
MEKFEKYYKYAFFIALFGIIGLIYKSCDDRQTYKEKDIQEVNLRKALTDTIRHFITQEGLIGAEKRTLQTELSTLKDNNLNLTENQKALIKEVERQNKTATTFAAALIELKAEVVGLKNDKPTVQTDSSVQFAPKVGDNSYDPNFVYDISIFNVKPFELKTPTLSISKIEFPNTQKINFNWRDNKEEGYPVSFSVINSNPYFKVNDIESYVIPEITLPKVKPTFWMKVGNFSKSSGGKIVIFGAGVLTGAALINKL